MCQHTATVGPVGSTAAEASSRRAAHNPAYREQWEANAAARDIAWQIVKYRLDHNLTQQELAARVGTSHSQISRIESGRHRMSLDTLRRIGDAFGLKLVITFAPKSESRPREEHFITV